jgi:hypothetical protein
MRTLVIILWILAIAVVCFAYPSESSDGVWNSRIITRERNQYSYDNAKAYTISAAPIEPFTCSASVIGNMVYRDDTDDAFTGSFCYCGTDADDTSYVWMRTNNKNVDCW